MQVEGTGQLEMYPQDFQLYSSLNVSIGSQGCIILSISNSCTALVDYYPSKIFFFDIHVKIYDMN